MTDWGDVAGGIIVLGVASHVAGDLMHPHRNYYPRPRRRRRVVRRRAR
jgi:hypothetical protein